MTGKASFHIRGIVLQLADGTSVVLNAGENMTILPQGDLITFAAQVPPGTVINNTVAYQPPIISDANAPKGSVYYSTDAGKLVFKDSATPPVIHALY